MSDILDIYEKLGGKVSRKDFDKLIEDKMEMMGGLCDERTAAMLVAYDLGVSGVGAVKIKDITADKKDVEFLGKIVSASDVREFSRQDGSSGRVVNLTMGDETGDIRVVLWDELADAVKTGDLKAGDVLKIKGFVKEGPQGVEVTIGRGGGIAKAEGETVNVRDPMVKISEIRPNMGNLCVRGVILSKQEPRSFNRKDGSKGVVSSVMLGDETGKIRVTLWDNKVKESESFNAGDDVEVMHGYSRESFNGGVEAQVGNRGIIRKSEIKVSFDEKTTPLGDVTPDGSFSVKGIVTGIDGVREFTTKDGRPGRLCSLFISDDSGRLRVVFWGEHADFAEALSVGDKLLVTDVQAKTGLKGDIELSANWRSTVRKI